MCGTPFKQAWRLWGRGLPVISPDSPFQIIWQKGAGLGVPHWPELLPTLPLGISSPMTLWAMCQITPALTYAAHCSNTDLLQGVLNVNKHRAQMEAFVRLQGAGNKEKGESPCSQASSGEICFLGPFGQ